MQYDLVILHLNQKADVVIPRFIDLDGSHDLVKIIDTMPLTRATLPDQSRVQITPLGFNEVGIH